VLHRFTEANSRIQPQWRDVGATGAFARLAKERQYLAHHVAPLWLDPGIGFGKTVEHNLSLIAHVHRFVTLARDFDAGILIGTSRKRFLERMGRDRLDVDQRLEGSIATEAWVMLEGVSMVRVHDAGAAVQLRELLVRPVEEVVA
jgi:dihydropteroate synthase